MTTIRGHCLCGDVAFEFEGTPNWVAHCHCESCRRNTSSPVTTFLGVPRAAFRWTGDQPASYESSPGVRRLFCGRCGSPMAFDADKYPDEMHFYVASLEDPEAFPPEVHVHFAEHLSWFDTADALKRFPHSGNGGG
jgi:hypothetical protein